MLIVPLRGGSPLNLGGFCGFLSNKKMVEVTKATSTSGLLEHSLGALSCQARSPNSSRLPGIAALCSTLVNHQWGPAVPTKEKREGSGLEHSRPVHLPADASE